MEQRLANWRASLPVYFRSDDVPPWFRQPRAILSWKEQNLRILLWRGSQRHFTSWLGKVDAARKCQCAAIETISDITAFCHENMDNLHLGISWYATYFIFQAALALDIHYLEKAVVDRLADTDSNGGEPAWVASIQQARGCLEVLGRTNRAANRCLAVLDRIHDYFSRGADNSNDPVPPVNLDPVHIETSPDSSALDNNWALSADPALHIFLDSPMDHQLFEGIDGFPSTLNEQYFDFAPNLYPRE
jgi:transcriptional regulatory protein GAL4